MYNDEMKCCPQVDIKEDIENVTQMTSEIKAMTVDALMMAYAINKHLFGKGEPDKENMGEPKCYRDELCLQGKFARKLCEELREIMRGIGV